MIDCTDSEIITEHLQAVWDLSVLNLVLVAAIILTTILVHKDFHVHNSLTHKWRPQIASYENSQPITARAHQTHRGLRKFQQNSFLEKDENLAIFLAYFKPVKSTLFPLKQEII